VEWWIKQTREQRSLKDGFMAADIHEFAILNHYAVLSAFLPVRLK
jgi:hypothetical protein